MFLFKRWKSTLIGFLTCTIVIVCLMLILWATIDVQAVIDANTALVEQAGAAGHLWVILLMLVVVNLFIPFNFDIPLPIPLLKEYNLNSSISGHAGLYFLILLIWLIGAFVGGLASRGGLKSGMSSAIWSFIFLDFLFAVLTASIKSGEAGMSGFPLFIVTFLIALFVGSFIFVIILGLVGGAIGGILGKMLFRKEKIDDTSSEE